MPARPPVTVVVPCRDRAERLQHCLAALTRHLSEDDELVVVDSASRDGSVQSTARAAGARVVHCNLPGVSRARNAGWRAATHTLVAFTDDDMEVTAGWLDALAAPLSDPQVGFATGLTAPPPDARYTGEPATVTRVQPPSLISPGTPGVYGGSNNVALSRAALEAVHGFDERLGPGRWLSAGEDLELFDRVLEAGYSGCYVSTAVAYHAQWRTRSQRWRLQWSYGKGMGARLAAMAWRRPRTAWALRNEVLRLQGLRTAARRVVPNEPTHGPHQVEDDSGWVGPVAWRLGALTGLLVGLLRLR